MRFAELRSPQLAGLDREHLLVVQPLAAVEQHGPHLPTATDTILCTAVAESVEARHPADLLLLPTLWLGASGHHLRLGATLNAPLEVYIRMLVELASPLLQDGYRRFLFLNGHGGNTDPVRIALRQLQEAHPKTLLAGGPYWAGADGLLGRELEGEHKFVGHACEFETSLMLHLQPDLVATDSLRDAGKLTPDTVKGFFVARDMRQRTLEGHTGRPDLASAAKGARLFTAIVERISALVRDLLNQPLPT
jgi:creatinine amidohydrolase